MYNDCFVSLIGQERRSKVTAYITVFEVHSSSPESGFLAAQKQWRRAIATAAPRPQEMWID